MVSAAIAQVAFCYIPLGRPVNLLCVCVFFQTDLLIFDISCPSLALGLIAAVIIII